MTTTVERPSTTATPGQVQWLGDQLRAWQAEGLLDADQATAILGRYVAARRLSLARLLLTVGACFVGVGLLWLVAANLDALAPSWRFAAVVALWLSLLAGGELLDQRHRSSALVGVVRLAAAFAFGAVVFQAAQSLQVPAYEPLLVGCWALGALLHAYAADAVPPLVVGVAAGTVWLVWEVVETSESVTAALLAVAAAGVVAVSLAVVHGRGRPAFSAPWRETGSLLLLGALFAAALTAGTPPWTWPLAAALGVAAALSAAALALGRGPERLEPLGAVGVLAVCGLFSAWDTGADVTGPGMARAVVAVAVYLLAAVAVAVLGVLHDSWRLTALATVALVAFTTMQSFAVFARIFDGAWLFLLLGLVLVATGWLFDRARRGLAAVITEEEQS